MGTLCPPASLPLKVFAANRPTYVQSVHSRHEDVENHQVGLNASKSADAILSISGLGNVESGPAKREADHIADMGIVVDHKHLAHRRDVTPVSDSRHPPADATMSAMTPALSVVAEADRRDFERDGFVVLESIIDSATLDMLREECGVFVARTDAWLEARGTDVFGITHRGKRYFIANRYRDSDRMPSFVYGDLMREVTTAFLGDTVFLFNEAVGGQGAEQGMKFAWHQDSGYVNFRDPGNTHRPYLTCWCALDDMTRENGTISVMRMIASGRGRGCSGTDMNRAATTLWATRANDPGVMIEMPAGSVAVFSSTSLHRKRRQHDIPPAPRVT